MNILTNDIKHVKLVGIVNVTPDSFSDGGLYAESQAAVNRIEELFDEGADIVDIGAESTNPKAHALSPEEEWQRLEPVLTAVFPKHAGQISIDSYHPETVERAVKTVGNDFIANDVTGMNNPRMRQIVAMHALPCIVSHLPARFGTDVHAAHLDATMDREAEVKAELVHRRQQLIDLGVRPGAIILDPGIGFGKTMDLNWRLLKFPALLSRYPVMVGYSRKRFLGEDRFTIEANLSAAKVAIAAGARYLRVHDVAAHRALLNTL